MGGETERRNGERVARHLLAEAIGGDFEIISCFDTKRAGDITVDIRNRLRHDALVIADLTDSNPNVMYEIGMRHGVGLPCVHIARAGSVSPFDVHAYERLSYDLTLPEAIQASQENLRKHVAATMAEEGVPHARSPIELWDELRKLLEPDQAPERYGASLDGMLEVVRSATHGAKPIVRLWGNRGSLGMPERKRFEQIGVALGRSLRAADMAISCTDLNEETLEHWTLRGVQDAPREDLLPVYLHFNTADTYATGRPAQKLLAEIEGHCQLIEVPYPYADADRLKVVAEEISREQVRVHDARIGSLLQCDVVVLAGGGKSAQHLIQLMSFLERRHIRAAPPILFVPLPWVPGVGRIAYQEFKGSLTDPDFLASVIAKRPNESHRLPRVP